MTWLHDVNFFVKLTVAFALMAVAWLAPSWRFGIPLALASVLALWAVRTPGFYGYLKGAALLTGLVIMQAFSLRRSRHPLIDSPAIQRCAQVLLSTRFP